MVVNKFINSGQRVVAMKKNQASGKLGISTTDLLV